MIERAYELLRTTLPFRRWKLPHADDVEFHVTAHKDRYGDHISYGGGKMHRVRISLPANPTLRDLIETMAHEMCHMRQRRTRLKSASHGKIFQRLADLVCRHHKFDRATF